MQAIEGTWVAWGSGNADVDVSDNEGLVRVPPGNPRYTLKRVFLSGKETEGYYYGFSNQFLWPFCHSLTDKARFLRSHWDIYKEVNERFAREVVREARRQRKACLVWMHDYHLAMAAQHVLEAEPSATRMIFWHIPWPPPEVFMQFPKAREFLRALLCYDVIAFHVNDYVENFIACCEEALGLRTSGQILVYGVREVTVCAHPIGIDVEDWEKNIRAIDPPRELKKSRLGHLRETKHLFIGVDRLDYTKGLIEKVQAFDRFLEKHPEVVGQVALAQKTVASRSRIATYQNYAEAFRQAVAAVNKKWSRGSWQPIYHLERDFSHQVLLSFYACGDACIVSPLNDGLNLVAKEYTICNPNGVLLLSKDAGVARELSGYLPIDPKDTESFSDAIYRALRPAPKQREQMRQLREQVRKNSIFHWLLYTLREAKPYLEAKH